MLSALVLICSLTIIGYCLWQWRNLRTWSHPYNDDIPPLGARGLTNDGIPPLATTYLYDDGIPPLGARRPTIAIIIPFRNEADHLPNLLNSLLRQNFLKSKYEIILVDDHSTDGSPDVIRQTGAAAGCGVGETGSSTTTGEPNLKLLHLRDYPDGRSTVAHKKAALTYGISQTTKDIILTTDADCQLAPNLLEEIASAIRGGARVVSGPVVNAPLQNFCDHFQALDLAAYQFLTAVNVRRGTPVLANGACFAFRREAFALVGGYEGVDHLPSGDDVLLLHKFRKVFPGEAFRFLEAGPLTTTAPVEGWKALWKQRLRWAGKAGNYGAKELERAQQLTFLACLSILVLMLIALFSDCGAIILWPWLVKVAIDYRCLQSFHQKYALPVRVPEYLGAALVYPFFLVAVGSAAVFGIKTGWKGRTA